MKFFRVTTSNGKFWQIHGIWADSESRAVELAESERGANDPIVLRAEAMHARDIGEDSAGRYMAVRVEPVHGTRGIGEEGVSFCHAGSEG